MIELTGPVTYRDGRVEVVVARQAEMAAWERYALRHGYPQGNPDNPRAGAPLTMIRYLGFAAAHAGVPSTLWPDFEEWDTGVVDVTLEAPADAEGDGATLPPTLEGRSVG